jgi:DNA segregation ATPase FtsK/SpoIIIE, S-DNA-T family
MRISLVTAYGEADLDIDADGSMTLADLFMAATGREAPTLTDVDGYPHASTTPLSSAGVADGSLIVVPSPPLDATGDVVTVLSQIAGPGAGRQRAVKRGRYDVGPGRRAALDHLDEGEVVQPAFTLDARPSGVTVESTRGRLDGVAATPPLSWTDQLLDIDGRVFRLDALTRAPALARERTIRSINRPPRDGPGGGTPRTQSIVDALDVIRRRTSRLWERRLTDIDALHVTVGLSAQQASPTSPGLESVLTPVAVDLSAHRAVGIVGRDAVTRGVARHIIVQLCAQLGPVDIGFAVISSADTRDRWDWVKWLPYGERGGPVEVLDDLEQLEPLIHSSSTQHRADQAAFTPSHLTFVLVDDPTRWAERGSPLRRLMALPWAPVRLIALAATTSELPAVCSAIIDVNGIPSVELLSERVRYGQVRPCQLDVELARRAALTLAGTVDTEMAPPPDGPATGVLTLLEHLRLQHLDADTIAARWRVNAAGGDLIAELGVTAHGELRFDLVKDGPHALIAGSRGAGKSELLRTMILSFAVNASPDEINFLIVDLERSPSLASIRGLPHVVGAIDALDEHLVSRLVRSLTAEVNRREAALHNTGTATLSDYRRIDGLPPLPRLVIVIDELYRLTEAAPGLLSTLVDLTQRGRALGLHLLLATQRPTATLDNKVKANTNMRLALRLHDDLDSTAVIGTDDATRVDRHQPGWGFAQVGGAAPVSFKTAFGGGRSRDTGQTMRMALRPFVMSRPPTPLEERIGRAGHGGDGPNDVQRILDAARAASVRHLPPHQPVLDPLPESVDSTELLALAGRGAFALEDLPDEQRSRIRSWLPEDDGSVIVYGVHGAGTTSTLLALAVGISHGVDRATVEVYGFDADASKLRAMRSLPTCATVVRADDAGAVTSLANELNETFDLRSAERRSQPTIVVFVDDYGSMQQQLDARGHGSSVGGVLSRILLEGERVGMYVALGARTASAVPKNLAGAIPNELVMELNDAHDYAGFGLRASEVPTFTPGRALDPSNGVELQVMTTERSLRDERAADHALFDSAQLHQSSRAADDAWTIAIGRDDITHEPISLRLEPAQKALVLARQRSHRTSLLQHITEAPPLAEAGVRRLVLSEDRHRWQHIADTDIFSSATTDEFVAAAMQPDRPRVVLVDDAHRFDPAELGPLFDASDDLLIVVAGGDPDALRESAGWSLLLRGVRCGVVLHPEEGDGELLGVAVIHQHEAASASDGVPGVAVVGRTIRPGHFIGGPA